MVFNKGNINLFNKKLLIYDNFNESNID
jgi:hypothetical protein